MAPIIASSWHIRCKGKWFADLDQQKQLLRTYLYVCESAFSQPLWAPRLLGLVCSLISVARFGGWKCLFPLPHKWVWGRTPASFALFSHGTQQWNEELSTLLFCCPTATSVTAVTQALKGTTVSWISWSVPLSPVWTMPRVLKESKTTAVPVGQVG